MSASLIILEQPETGHSAALSASLWLPGAALMCSLMASPSKMCLHVRL